MSSYGQPDTPLYVFGHRPIDPNGLTSEQKRKLLEGEMEFHLDDDDKATIRAEIEEVGEAVGIRLLEDLLRDSRALAAGTESIKNI